MKSLAEIRTIVDSHRQLYEKSCSPSLVEMILKIEGVVSSDYYELQAKYKNDQIGISVFDGFTIKGLNFFTHKESRDGLFADRINKEWTAGRLFAAYTMNDDLSGYHGWVVSAMNQGTASLLSKYSELGNGEGRQTAESTLQITEAVPPKITDLLFYSLPTASGS
jgi:hypothetical protein